MKTHTYRFVTPVDIQHNPCYLRSHNNTSGLEYKIGVAFLLYFDTIIDIKEQRILWRRRIGCNDRRRGRIDFYMYHHDAVDKFLQLDMRRIELRNQGLF